MKIDPYKQFGHYQGKDLDFLKQNLPEIKRLESLEDLEDLKLVRLKNEAPLVVTLEYVARAPTFFPHVRKNLIDNGIAKKHNILGTTRKNRDTHEERYGVIMGFYGNRLQLYLELSKEGKAN